MLRTALVTCGLTTASGLNFFDLGRMMPRSIKGFPDGAKSLSTAPPWWCHTRRASLPWPHGADCPRSSLHRDARLRCG